MKTVLPASSHPVRRLARGCRGRQCSPRNGVAVTLPPGNSHLVEVVDLDDREAQVLQVSARSTGRHRLPRDERGTTTAPTRPPQLQQRLQHDVVLVAVGDEDQVDVVGQVVERVPVAGGGCRR